MNNIELISEAINASKYAYSPYSKFRVGAALLTSDDTVYKGCNIENASFSATVCAERTAFFKAVSDGKKSFKRIAIVGMNGSDISEYTAPCGVCRQIMREFCDDDFEIVLVKSESEYKILKLAELLPHSFTNVNLGENYG